MALAYSVRRNGVEGRYRWVEYDVTFDASYPTGGEAVTLADIGLNEVRRVYVVYAVDPDGNSTARTDDGKEIVPDLSSPTAPKLKLYTGGAEAADTSNQSAVIKRVRFLGS